MKNKIVIISFLSICLISGIILSKIYFKDIHVKKNEILKSNEKNMPDKQTAKIASNDLENTTNKNDSEHKSNLKKSKSEVNGEKKNLLKLI